VSYGRLWRSVRVGAAGLQALGLSRDDRVAIYLDKRIETVEAIFATSAAAGVFVPVNHVLNRRWGHILRDCGPRVLITSPERLPLLLAELTSCRVSSK
jgi:acyl-CoA synthetase (AMP-forming)/AMP-acid ligase II